MIMVRMFLIHFAVLVRLGFIGVNCFSVDNLHSEQSRAFRRSLYDVFLNNAENRAEMCQCGQEQTARQETAWQETARIVGGKVVAPPHRFPWVVALVFNLEGKDVYYCGGALISKQYVLTAAHCIHDLLQEGQEPSVMVPLVKVALGAHNSDDPVPPAALSAITLHPSYDTETYQNDIAVLKLKDPAELAGNVRLICLPPSTDFKPPSDEMATVAGWGWQTNERGSESNVLRDVGVQIASHDACVKKYGGHRIFDTNICAGGVRGKDSCQGDSGGPLFVKEEGNWFVMGVVSWGMVCGQHGYPGVYTRVTSYLDWIGDQIKDSPQCQ